MLPLLLQFSLPPFLGQEAREMTAVGRGEQVYSGAAAAPRRWLGSGTSATAPPLPQWTHIISVCRYLSLFSPLHMPISPLSLASNVRQQSDQWKRAQQLCPRSLWYKCTIKVVGAFYVMRLGKIRHPFSKACLQHSQTVIQPCTG